MLSTNDILIAEFGYIVQTANQANEDRARITVQYFVTMGSILAAIFAASLSPFDESVRQSVQVAFCLVFVGLGIHSTLTILQLVRLRLAWIESAEAMNAIKEYYIAQQADAGLQDALKWRAETVSSKYKSTSLSAIMALQVAVLGGLAFGSGVYFLGLAVGLAVDLLLWVLSFGVGGAAILAQVWLYRHLLK